MVSKAFKIIAGLNPVMVLTTNGERNIVKEYLDFIVSSNSPPNNSYSIIDSLESKNDVINIRYNSALSYK